MKRFVMKNEKGDTVDGKRRWSVSSEGFKTYLVRYKDSVGTVKNEYVVVLKDEEIVAVNGWDENESKLPLEEQENTVAKDVLEAIKK